MHAFRRFRSHASMVLALTALASLLSGFVFFVGIGAPPRTARALGLTYSDLSKTQQRLLDGFVSSEIAAAQNAHTSAALHSTYFPSSHDGGSQNLGTNTRSIKIV